ncbi:hypothetical protein BFL35_05885 [Clavibacter michiganensis]|nr:hypothetical protein BFL35_05885 [Clavibacter michiganensis]
MIARPVGSVPPVTGSEPPSAAMRVLAGTTETRPHQWSPDAAVSLARHVPVGDAGTTSVPETEPSAAAVTDPAGSPAAAGAPAVAERRRATVSPGSNAPARPEIVTDSPGATAAGVTVIPAQARPASLGT